MTIIFTVEFLVETATRGNFRAFIENLRTRLAVRSSHNRPTTAIQQFPPTQFFEVVLRTNQYAVRFRYQADNLYLTGYRRERETESESAREQWWEFNNDSRAQNEEDRHLIQGSSFLGFNGSYKQLATVADVTIENLRVGSRNLVSATNQLAVTTDRRQRARRLIVVIMMTSEAIRFNPVLDYMVANFNNQPGTSADQEGLIETWLRTLVTSWEDLSAVVQRADAFPEVRFQIEENNLRIPPNDRQIRNIADALAILGIMLGLCFPERRSGTGGGRLTSLAAATPASGGGMCFMGSPLLEVFSLRVDNIDNEDPGELYGTITVTTGLYLDYIYNRTRNNAESIKPGHKATLTGPTRGAISALGPLTITLLLTDKDVISADDQIVNDAVSWQPNDIGNVYDKLISHQLSSSRGSVTLNYAVLRNAVSAEITITLEDGGEEWCEVYGHAFVRYFADDDDSDDHQTLLFQTTSSNYVQVKRWQSIPLLRSVLALPLDSSAQLTVSFYDYDPITPDDQIAQDTIQLSPPNQIPGNTQQAITGEGRNFVNVAIRWNFAI